MKSFCPCGFAIHRVINSGSVTRADGKTAVTSSGITNPRGHKIPDDKEGRHKVDPTLKHSHSFRMNGKRLEIKMNVSPNHDPDTWLRNAPIVVIGLVKEVVGLDIEVQLCRIP